MATVASPPPARAEVPGADPSEGDAWVISGVAAELARRLGASVGFVRFVLMIAGYAWFWPVTAVYGAAALLVPHGGRRRPGWSNLLGLSRLVIALVAIALVFTPPVSFTGSGVFVQGPAVWLAYSGAALAGLVALLTSGRSAAAHDEKRCRRIMLGWLPAVALTATVAVGLTVAPGVRWELVLELGIVALGAWLAVSVWRGARAAPIAPTVFLALLAILLASSGARLQGGAGDFYARPGSLASLHTAYRRAIGDGTLDLRGLRGSGGRTARVEASIGIGNLTIIVPANVDGTVDVRIGLGGLNPIGAERSGFNVRRVVHLFPAGNPAADAGRHLHLELSAMVGRGCVTIDQQGYGGGGGC